MQRAPAVSRVVGYAYPWDVIGDSGFADRVRSLDIAEVALGASYHGTRVQDGVSEDDATMAQLVGSECAGVLLDTRLAAQAATRADVLAALRDLVPTARITLHGHPDPWATGPSPAVTAVASAQVDAVLVPAWVDAPATREAIAAARRQGPDRVSVGAYVTVLPPADPATIDEHVGALIAAGADELHLYHLGLVNRERLAVLGRLASLQR